MGYLRELEKESERQKKGVNKQVAPGGSLPNNLSKILDEMDRKREAAKNYHQKFFRRNLNENMDDEDLTDNY